MKSADPRKGLGCLVLFALPFAGFGAFAGYRMISGLWEWYEMRSWIEVPAELVHVELETHQDSDSTTYEVKAEYLYSYDGTNHRGTRVAIHEGADNLSDFHEETHRELSRLRSAGKPHPCYVDPRNPSRSVLVRDLRWGLLGFYSIFFVVFGGVGVGLIAGGIHGSRRLARENALRETSPKEPWLHKDEWRGGRIRSVAKATLVTSAALAVIWNAISAPLLFLVPRELARGNAAAVIGLLFPAVGAGLIIWVGRSFVRLWKFGESVFEMTSTPGVIGGRIEGLVRPTKELGPAVEIEVRLSVVVRARVGSGDDRRTEEGILWQRTSIVAPSRSYGVGPRSIPVSFDVPEDLPPTDESDPDHQTVWRLDVTAEVPGVDYEARFEVPVFRTGTSVTRPRTQKVETPAVDLETRLKKAGLRTELLPAGKRFVSPRARNIGSALAFTGFFVLWTGIAVALYDSDAPRLFPWVTFAFDAIFLLVLLDLWLYSSVLEVRPGEMSFRGGIFGRGRERRWTASEVERIEPRRGEQSGTRLFYKLDVVGRHGRGETIARRLPDLDTAEALAGEIERTLRA